jgi:hypothetical protein
MFLGSLMFVLEKNCYFREKKVIFPLKIVDQRENRFLRWHEKLRENTLISLLFYLELVDF